MTVEDSHKPVAVVLSRDAWGMIWHVVDRQIRTLENEIEEGLKGESVKPTSLDDLRDLSVLKGQIEAQLTDMKYGVDFWHEMNGI